MIKNFLSTKDNALTRQSYTSALRQFAIFKWSLPPYSTKPIYDPMAHVTDEQWQTVTPEDIRAYLYHIKNSTDLKPSSQKLHLTALKRFVDFMAEKDFYDEAVNGYIQNRIDAPEGDDEHHAHVTPADQNALLKVAADQPGLKGIRDYLVIRMLLETGVRRFELVNIKVGNISIKGGRPNIYVAIAKRGKTRDIPIEQEIYDLILEWLAKSGQGVNDDNPILCPVRERHRGQGDYTAMVRSKPMSTRWLNFLIDNLVNDADLEGKITPHSFRVSMITDSIEGGASLRETQKVAGHADPRLTAEVYDRSQHTEPIARFRKHKLYRPEEEQQ
jgi:integrase/recombinase XerD